LCSSLCSSSPNFRVSAHFDRSFADHRLVHDSIPGERPPRLLAPHRRR